MGYYIETPMNKNKAEQMATVGAVAIDKPDSFADIPEGHTLLCVVQNGLFDARSQRRAVGICFDDQEFKAFGEPSDPRPKTWMTIDSASARDLCPDYAANV